MIGGHKYGDKVIRISDHVVVKYGGVQECEAITQEFAFDNVDGTIEHVPKVYRYILSSRRSSRPNGYLFMEYLHGQNLVMSTLLFIMIYPRALPKYFHI